MNKFVRDVIYGCILMWGSGEVGNSGDGEMGRWGDGEMGRWGDGELGRWGGVRSVRGVGITTNHYCTDAINRVCTH
jgi:hypothetical protein